MLSVARHVLALTIVLCTTGVEGVEGVALAAPAGALSLEARLPGELRVAPALRARDAAPTLPFERWASACEAESERIEREEEPSKQARDGVGRVPTDAAELAAASMARCACLRAEHALWSAPARRPTLARGPPVQ